MARPRSVFQIGLDLGNGNIKIATDDFSERIPSYIDNCPGSDAVGCVQFPDDAKRNFCLGYGASHSKTGLPVSSDKNIKLRDIQKLYLGALAHLPVIPRTMQAQIIVSSHAWESHKAIIKSNLETELEVILSGTSVKLTTEVLMVVPEGFGAVAFANKAKIATLDFGTGTTLLTPYQNGRPMETKTSNEGVQKLINMICDRMKGINNGYPGDANEVRRCLELGKLTTAEGCSFKVIYQEMLSLWWNSYSKDLSDQAKQLSESGYEIVCVGGGVALPGFSNILTKKGFSPVLDRPEMASVKGLYQLAVKKGATANV
jgi:Actin like proteins N terminal domain